MSLFKKDYELVELGKMGRDLGKKDMVFCIIYCKDGQQYKNYDYFLNSNDEYIKNKVNMLVPTVLTITRYDGKRGFVGGNVELHHTTLIDAIKDELSEELGMTNIDESRLELFSTYANKKRHITSFIYRVNYEELLDIVQQSENAKHRFSEVCGVDLLQLHEISIPNIRKNVFSGTGLEELNLLIEREELYTYPKVKEALKLAECLFYGVESEGKDYYKHEILKAYKKSRCSGDDEKHQVANILYQVIRKDTNFPYELIENQFGNEIMRYVNILIEKNKETQDISPLIEKALKLAKEHFEPMLRNNGKNYYDDHILKVYETVKYMGYPQKYQLVAILHDIYEDTDIPHEYIAKEFGKEVANAVEVLTIRKSELKNCPAIEFIKVKEATGKELTEVVRFADRYSNLQQTSIHANSPDFVERIINKTKAYYIPNFNGEFKSLLEEEVKRLSIELKNLNK